MAKALLASILIDIPSASGCCCGVWTREFWQDGNATDEDREGLFEASLRPFKDRASAALMQKRLLSYECPYGQALPLDVTWPAVPEELTNMVEPFTILKFFAVVYAYLPWIPVFFVIADFCICRGTRQLWILLWLGLLISINEVVVKKCFAEPRPGSRLELRGEHGRLQGSCIMTCGMPSSHSAIAMGWFTLSILDATVRTHLGTSRQATVTGGRITHTQSILMAEQKKIVDFMKNFCLVPWVKKDVLNVRELISFGLFWFFLMVPVPFMRVVLCDHTPNQVAVGSTLGLVLAVLWWRAVRVLQRRFRAMEGRQICYGLLWHDYYLPVPEHEEILRRQQQLELGQTRQPPLRTF